MTKIQVFNVMIMRTISISLLVAFLFSGCDLVDKDPIPAKLVRNVLHSDNYQVPQNGSAEIDVLANDTIKGSFTLLMGTPKFGNLNRSSGFKYTYQATPGFVGIDSISYQVTIDGSVYKAEVIITVQRNCFITAITDTILVTEGGKLVFDPLANDINCSSSLTATYGNYSENGLSVIPFPNGHLQVTAANGFFKTKTVSYTICNNFNECTTGTIVIKAIPNAACAGTLQGVADSYSTNSFSPLLLPFDRLLTNDNYCANDIDVNQIEIIGTTQHGSLQVFGNYIFFLWEEEEPLVSICGL